ncbi:MAG: hemolysin family protein [Candidatus Dojkabacteria bacterium]
MDLIPLVLILSLFLSGFFSGSEIAFFSLSDAKIHALMKKRVKGAKLIYKVKSNPDRLLVTILVGNNIVNIGSSALATMWVTDTFGNAAVGAATGVLTLFVLTFGEIIPKSIANNYSMQIARFAAVPLFVLGVVFLPVSILFEGLSKIVNTMFKKKEDSAGELEAELRSMAVLGYRQGSIEAHEQKFIQKIFTLNDTRVTKAMTPYAEMFTISGERTINTVIKDIKQTHYSRLPVYIGEENKICGFLYIKDILKFPKNSWNQLQVKDIMRRVLFVDPNTILSDLYGDFVENQTHIGVVKNKSGEVVGLITMEDIIEEVLGDIEDETDFQKVATEAQLQS